MALYTQCLDACVYNGNNNKAHSILSYNLELLMNLMVGATHTRTSAKE